MGYFFTFIKSNAQYSYAAHLCLKALSLGVKCLWYLVYKAFVQDNILQYFI